jgi:uncharacterized protein YcbK (DUF882 family)
MTETAEPLCVTSGYRSPETNEYLRRKGKGAAPDSFRLEGKAIDFFLPGTSTAAVASAVYHATGVRVTDSPINPLRLCSLLEQKKKEG